VEQFTRERALLDRMAEVADASRSLPDARVRYLVAWIAKHMCPGLLPIGSDPPKSPPSWNDTRLLIFTEYDDTKRYLERQLAAAIAGTERAAERIDVFHGPTPAPRREEIKRAFNTSPSRHPLRILIATDAAREGVNLQSHCSSLFHFDVPWNPSRLDQRNGRIDRKLQPAPEVFCHYFVYTKRPEDRVLQALVRKTETIKRELGSLSKVLEPRLAGTLKGGIAHRDAERLARAVEAETIEAEYSRSVEEELESARLRKDALQGELERLRTLLAQSKEATGFDREQFRTTLDAALALVGGDRLKPTSGAPGGNGALSYSFPALDCREGADPTWADTLDALRAPRKRDRTLWEWRKESPLRPVVFEAPDTMTDEVVQLHLAHRVVERLLGRFVSQGFVYHDLSRACLAQTDDPVPRVILLGRLSLYGPGAARLHEELLPVAARWVEPSQRKEPIKPYAAESEAKTMALLEKALLPESHDAVPAKVRQRLRETAARDVEELLPHLETLGRELARAAEKKLAGRASDEAKKMVEILESQRTRITATVVDYEKPQRTFDFDEAAKRQLESNRRHWRVRLDRIDEELRGEPKRIRQVYDVRASRIEPVGLVYLWPVTG